MNGRPQAFKSGIIDPGKVSSKYEEPGPCTCRKPGPAEALKLGIKLPWDGKVQRMEISALTKELFIALESYGLTRLEIMDLFHTYSSKFLPLIKEWGLPNGVPGGDNRAARAKNMEHPKGKKPIKPIDLKNYYDTEAGRKKLSEMNTPELSPKITDEALDAELEQVESELAELFKPVSEAIEPPHVATPAEVQEFFEETAPVDPDDLPISYVLVEPGVEETEGKPFLTIDIKCSRYTLGQLKQFLSALPEDMKIDAQMRVTL